MSLKLELSPRRRIEAELLEIRLDDSDVIHEELQCPEEGIRHHLVAFSLGAGWVVAAFLLIVAVLLTNGPVEPLIFIFPAVLRGAWLILRTYEDRFVVTDMRIFRIQGVFDQHTAAMSLSRIVDFTVEQPALGQLMGYGHLVFENAAQDQGLREIRFVPAAADVLNQIQALAFVAGGGPAKHKGGRGGPPPSSVSDEETGEIPVVH